MSESIEDLKKCFRCFFLKLMVEFQKDKKRNDGSYPQCESCREDFILKNYDEIKKHIEQNREQRIIYMRNRRETGNNDHLITNTRNRTYKALKRLSKSSSSVEIVGIDIQMIPEVNWSELKTDHVKQISMFDVYKAEQSRQVFFWKLLVKKSIKKKNYLNFLFYR